MHQAFIQSPLGITKLEGNSDGLASISVLNSKEPLTDVIPTCLEEAAHQLKEYFQGERQEFNLTLNPMGTWQKPAMDCDSLS